MVDSRGAENNNNKDHPNQLMMDAMMARMLDTMHQTFENMRADMKRVVSVRSRRSHDHSSCEPYQNNSSRTHASKRRSHDKEEPEPKPPDSVRYSSNQFKWDEEKYVGRGEWNFKQPDHTRSSTWSKSHKTSHTPQSMDRLGSAYHQPTNKIQLYSFSGSSSYLEWERNMEDWFYYNCIKEEKRLSYAVHQLTGKAYKLWVKEQDDRSFYNEQTITTWKELKKLLKDQYAPRHKGHTTTKSPRKKREHQEKTSARTVHKGSIQSGLTSPHFTPQRHHSS